MVDGQRGHKANRAVAVLAAVGRQNMQWTFAGGGGAIVTTDAVARDADMIEVRR